jgi:hypothetical protein
MLKNCLRLFLIATFAVAAAIPITASAAGGGGGGGTGITVVVGQPSREQAHLVVTVPVTITCTAPLPSGFAFGQVNVQILQVANKTVNYGNGFLILTSCPTKPTTFKVVVIPGGGPTPPLPFHHGVAVESAFASACDPTNTCIAGSDGPKLVHI